MNISPGAQSVSLIVDIVDDSGLPVTGLVAATFPPVYIVRAGEAVPTAVTLSDLAAQDSAYSGGGVKELVGGSYRFDAPNSAFATANPEVKIKGEATDKRLIHPSIKVAYEAVDLQTIKTQSVTCGAAVTVSPYLGSTGAAINGTAANTLSGHDPGATLGTSTFDHTTNQVSLSSAAIQSIYDFATASIAASGSFGKYVLDSIALLLTRVSASRAAYWDNLNVGGAVASQADIDALNQSASRRVLLVTVGQYERPEASSVTYTVEARTFDADGAAVAADSNPTLTGTGSVTGSLAANIGTVSNPSTGVYRWQYTVASSHNQEQIRFDLSATIDSSTFTLSTYTQVVDLVAATWTSADATKLTAIYDKLPSSDFLTGTDSSDGSGYSTHSAADVVTAINANATQITLQTNAANAASSASTAATQATTAATQATAANGIVGSVTYGNSALKTLIDGAKTSADSAASSASSAATAAGTAATAAGNAYTAANAAKTVVESVSHGNAALADLLTTNNATTAKLATMIESDGAGGWEWTSASLTNVAEASTGTIVVYISSAAVAASGAAQTGALTIIKHSDWSHELTGLGSLANAAEILFTVKVNASDDDDDAVFQISTTRGLVRVNADAAADSSLGELEATNTVTGIVAITLNHAVTALLEAHHRRYYSVKIIRTDGSAVELTDQDPDADTIVRILHGRTHTYAVTP